MAEGSRAANLDQNDADLLTESGITPPPPVDTSITQTQVIVPHGQRQGRKMKPFAVPEKVSNRLEPDQKDQLIREPKKTQKEPQRLWNQDQMHKNKFEDLRNKYGELRKRCHLLEQDNEVLRSVIANMSSPRQPLLNEDHYGREFDSLKGEIENWAVGQSKKADPKNFGEVSRDEIMSILESLGNCGRQSAKFLESKLFMLYQYRRTRMALIRHVNGLFLFDKVLSRYIFGCSRKSSNYHEAIEDQLFHQGLP